MKSIWVIAWRYGDGSGYGVAHYAFESEVIARAVMKLISAHATVVYELHRLDVFVC